MLGGAGGIGQPLSLLMKLNPRVTELALYDIRGAPGPGDVSFSKSFRWPRTRCCRWYRPYQHEKQSHRIFTWWRWIEACSHWSIDCSYPSGCPPETRHDPWRYMEQNTGEPGDIDSRIDLFNTNASIVRDLAKAVADAAPEANILIISNPVWAYSLGSAFLADRALRSTPPSP